MLSCHAGELYVPGMKLEAPVVKLTASGALRAPKPVPKDQTGDIHKIAKTQSRVSDVCWWLVKTWP